MSVSQNVCLQMAPIFTKIKSTQKKKTKSSERCIQRSPDTHRVVCNQLHDTSPRYTHSMANLEPVKNAPRAHRLHPGFAFLFGSIFGAPNFLVSPGLFSMLSWLLDVFLEEFEKINWATQTQRTAKNPAPHQSFPNARKHRGAAVPRWRSQLISCPQFAAWAKASMN